MSRKKSNAAEADSSAKKSAALPHTVSTVVVGDGWSALGATAFLALSGKQVTWVSGTGSRLLSPLPILDSILETSESVERDGESLHESVGAETWETLARGFGIDTGPLVHGTYLREFRNKAFREAAWTKAPTPETRREVRDELLGDAERVLVPLFEKRFTLMTPFEIEERVRAKLGQKDDKMGELVRRIEEAPLQEVIATDGAVSSVRLANGQVLQADQVIFADRWNQIGQLEGLPKGITFHRKREPVGVLQAEFEHEIPMAAGVQEGFFGTLHRETGEDADRHVWGYFTSDGARSIWSLCMSPEEGEDNHTIGKRLRRMKNALDKMFSGSGWLPEGKADYLSNVRAERVRFEESILFTAGEVPERSPRVAGMDRLHFLTDGYGPTAAFRQVRALLGAEIDAVSARLATLAREARSDAETENFDITDPGLS
jgi:hypothetical protein